MYSIQKKPSPNYTMRQNVCIDILVLHYTDMEKDHEALQRLCDPQSKVSAHYFITRSGEVLELVSPKYEAWHAGISFWNGHHNINNRSIGIELSNPGHSNTYLDFPQPQIQTLIALCRDILERYPIPPSNVVGHSDIAPTRKKDPGERFPWRELARHGIGIFPSPQNISFTNPLCSIKEFLEKLASYGYGIDNNIEPHIYIETFQRHFRPQNLSGQIDTECDQILDQVLALKKSME